MNLLKNLFGAAIFRSFLLLGGHLVVPKSQTVHRLNDFRFKENRVLGFRHGGTELYVHVDDTDGRADLGSDRDLVDATHIDLFANLNEFDSHGISEQRANGPLDFFMSHIVPRKENTPVPSLSDISVNARLICVETGTYTLRWAWTANYAVCACGSIKKEEGHLLKVALALLNLNSSFKKSGDSLIGFALMSTRTIGGIKTNFVVEPLG